MDLRRGDQRFFLRLKNGRRGADDIQSSKGIDSVILFWFLFLDSGVIDTLALQRPLYLQEFLGKEWMCLFGVTTMGFPKGIFELPYTVGQLVYFVMKNLCVGEDETIHGRGVQVNGE